jgi:hypothetical protein
MCVLLPAFEKKSTLRHCCAQSKDDPGVLTCVLLHALKKKTFRHCYAQSKDDLGVLLMGVLILRLKNQHCGIVARKAKTTQSPVR